ncbi:MAG: DUF493 family protein [Bacteroidetes bacterium]|nr:DUF493 family protein [Bacteroidota bacterium]MDA1118915.1 DUF493 family protein [Bacteroidota bacterium]
MAISISDFKRKLEEQHAFPSIYIFKFIVPSGKESEVIGLLPEGKITSKISQKGNYISITAELMIIESNQVIEIYQEAHKVEGLIAL